MRISTATALLMMGAAMVVATADDKPAGEMWRQTASMEMAGMTMPPQTLEMCVPVDKADQAEALSKLQGLGMNGNCSLQDAKHDGDRFTAKLVCTGKQPAQGSVETIYSGDHAQTTMSFAMNGQQVTLKVDSQKVGTACTPMAFLPVAK